MPEARVGVGAMVLRDGKVLLGRRHEDPEKADSKLHGEGTWTMPGGKVDFGETVATTIRRELKEETNLDVVTMEVMGVNDEILPDVHFVTVGFLVTTFTGEPEVMEPDEITEWRWFSLNELPSPLYPASAKVIENYKQKKMYIESEQVQ